MESELEVPEHKHPLKLINLQLQYEEEEEDEDGYPIMKDGFHGVTCRRCEEEIHVYHRYYYTCCSSSCDDKKVFSLHKFCAELSIRLDHASHPQHTFYLYPYSNSFSYLYRYAYYDLICKLCKREHEPGARFYRCNKCYFCIDLKCALEVGKNVIHHPCHPHLLMSAILKPISCECSACGKEHKGIFYQCTICTNFAIHSECAFLPESLLIQERTHDAFYHPHPLTIAYSFPQIDQKAKHDPRCRVCRHDFVGKEDHWIYKCDKCLYYVHLYCAISLPPLAGFGNTIKNYEDVDHPGLLHLPFPDETYSLPKHYLFFQQSSTTDPPHHHHHLIHDSHQHPLILVDGETQIDTECQTSLKVNLSSSMCHDPMKKTQLLCNGCLRPIMSTMPFYICANDDEIQIQGVCNNFALHEWCTQLPPKVQNHPGHPQHTLNLICSNIPGCLFGLFRCNFCDLPCNGFAYGCFKCEYFVDVTCGLIPREITHKAHPNHLLSIVQVKDGYTSCLMCLKYTQGHHSFHCNTCNIYIHPDCALLLAETIRHKYDKNHPMKLSYLPIENHKSEYFCEICEEDLNPHASFYHCKDCALSVHTNCAPLILQCETETYNRSMRSTHLFVNIKFGGIYKTNSHPHPFSFAQGIVLDGYCCICHERLQYKMIFKCLECKFAYDHICCERFLFGNSLAHPNLL
ncbi:hypothetical protein Lser_V15G38645 [Lactuca serriola]